jgi:sugar lactone lactonase YvrE
MRLVVLVVSVLAIGLVGCGDDAEVCSEGGIGSLQINVSGLPMTTNAAVTVTRGAESRTVTGTTLLEGLGSGTWTVTVAPVATPVGLIRAAHDATPEPQEVCVRDGGVAAAQVAYQVIPSSQKLWLSTSNGSAEVEAFAETSLRATGTQPASVLLRSSPGIPRAAGLAFDRRGNLWVALGSGELRRYPASVLGDSGTRTPDITLKGPALSTGTPGPIGIAFDASGNLWTSVGWSKKVLRFGASQITASGSPTPEVEISGVGDPHALAFDSAGNLWVGDYTTGAPRVHKVAVAALAASGTVSPARSIDAKDTSPTISFTSPAGLAFDASGNLWVAYGTQGVVVRLTPADQGGTGTATITPSVQIDAGGPKGLAFDEAGNLWMAYNAGKISRLSPAQLTVSGAPTPDVVITSPDLGATDGVAIYPAPANLPLYHRLP